MPDNEPDYIWRIYCELGEIERHFNNLQSNYRALVSTWLLAAFAGIGFVLSKELTPSIPRELFVFGIGVGTSIGIYLLWVLDLLVYHRLLDAAYIEALNLERSYKWLPPYRINIRVLLGGKLLPKVVCFYLVSTGIMASIGGLGITLWLIRCDAVSPIIPAVRSLITCCMPLASPQLKVWPPFVALYAISLLGVLRHMHHSTESTPKLEEQLKLQYK
jgi:hypothetical protein